VAYLDFSSDFSTVVSVLVFSSGLGTGVASLGVSSSFGTGLSPDLELVDSRLISLNTSPFKIFSM
jgi:hypothetical protein